MTDTKQTTGTNKHKRNLITFLLSVCLFLAVICACLLVALILIGKNLANIQQCNNNQNRESVPNKFKHNHHNNSEIISVDSNEKGAFDGDFGDRRAISVKIKVNNKKNNDNWSTAWRLPKDVIPKLYNLTLFPDMPNNRFKGINNMTILLKDSRNHIIFHSNKLNVTVVRLFTHVGQEIEVLDHHSDQIHQLYVVDLEDSIKRGVYYLYIEFEGPLTDKIGLYRSVYTNQNGQQR